MATKELNEGDVLWQPSSTVIENANLTHYQRWLADTKNIQTQNYSELWQWSVNHVEDFWESLFDYFNLKYSQSWDAVLPQRTMPGAKWFRGAHLNYAENIFAKMTEERPMMLYKGEDTALQEIAWSSIYQQVNQPGTGYT